jgi:glycosyltransferase involved in cell wall biosynthesis
MIAALTRIRCVYFYSGGGRFSMLFCDLIFLTSMRVAFITRSTLYNVPGGDTVQILQTVKYLGEYGIEADICLTNQKIDYQQYHVLHFTNITRPSDILFHLARTTRPFAISPFLVDYSEYDRKHRKGLSGIVLRKLSANANEYAKTFGRWLYGKDVLQSKSYLWKGQRRSIRHILEKAAMVLPNSEAEYKKLEESFGIKKDYAVVPFGVDPSVFKEGEKSIKDDKMVLCAARIEGIKNQLNLIKALNNTSYTLLLIGSPAPNQKSYYEECRKIAAANVIFHERISQQELRNYYKRAKVHVLPSWFETCGLSSLEAAAMGCNVAITEKGYTREYFGDDAFYCDPGSPESIFNEIDKAARTDCQTALQEKILHHYTSHDAARVTAEAYRKIVS